MMTSLRADVIAAKRQFTQERVAIWQMSLPAPGSS